MRLKFPESERPKILAASQATLWQPDGAEALKYLREERHLADDVIREFQFGYCPREFNHELAGRIIMPLCNPYGDIVAFTSRKTDAPKRFQHWHESFDKSNYLYGLHIAKQHIRRTGKAIVVEGQFDVTYCHTAGFKMTVGLCGSAFSIINVATLSRYCNEVYLALDPDKGGYEGVMRAIEMHKLYDLVNFNIHFIPTPMPNDLDPDEFIYKHGKQAMIDILRSAKGRFLNG